MGRKGKKGKGGQGGENRIEYGPSSSRDCPSYPHAKESSGSNQTSKRRKKEGCRDTRVLEKRRPTDGGDQGHDR